MKDKHKTIVVFRKFNHTGTIIALFPAEIHSGNDCMSYMRVGQHSGANYEYVIKDSFATEPSEYKDLQNELENLGYNLKIQKRYTKANK